MISDVVKKSSLYGGLANEHSPNQMIAMANELSTVILDKVFVGGAIDNTSPGLMKLVARIHRELRHRRQSTTLWHSDCVLTAATSHNAFDNGVDEGDAR